MKQTITFKGKKLTEMSRDELIETIEFLFNDLKRVEREKEHEREFLFNAFILPKNRLVKLP